MIIYNKTWLINLQVQNDAEALHDAHCLSTEELANIKAKHPAGFYTPGIFIRIGLFLQTCVTVLFSFGLATLLMEKTGALNSFVWPLFLGLVCAVVLEVMVKSKNYYRAGVDDALLWMSAIFIAGALWWMLTPNHFNSGHADYLILSLLFFILSLYFNLRFADVLMSAVNTLALLGMVFFFWTRFGFMGTATVPFVIMLAAGTIYVQALSLNKKIKIKLYRHCLAMVQIVGLLTLYAAGNYFITDWANHALNNMPQNIKLEVKWAPFFWVWTMLLPLVYIGLGVAKKNSITLRVGLLSMAAGIFTFRTYYHIMSIELALIIAGLALLIVVYLIVRYLKTPKNGITYADIDNGDNANNINIEGLITVATFKHPHTPDGPTNKFGGGDFGGGGSGGKF